MRRGTGEDTKGNVDHQPHRPLASCVHSSVSWQRLKPRGWGGVSVQHEAEEGGVKCRDVAMARHPRTLYVETRRGDCWTVLRLRFLHVATGQAWQQEALWLALVCSSPGC